MNFMKPLLIFALTATLASVGFSWIRAEAKFPEFTPDPVTSLPELVLETGHSQIVKSIIFSPDNQWVASGSADGTVKIWDFETGQERRSFAGHTNFVKTIACSPDGMRIASGSLDTTIRIWDVNKGGELKKITSQKASIETLTFSPDGKRIASGASDNTVLISDVETGADVMRFPGHLAAISALAFSPDGRMLASGSADKTVIIWDTATGKKLKNIEEHTDTVSILRFSNDGEILAAVGKDKTITLTRTSKGSKLPILGGNADAILAVNFLPDGKLISADSRGKISTWDLTAKLPLQSVSEQESKNALSPLESAAFSNNGAYLAIGRGNGTAATVDTKTGLKLNSLENHTVGSNGIAFSADRHWLAAASYDNSIKLWDLQNGTSVPPLKGHTGRVSCVVFHPKSRLIISGSLDGTIRVWDTFLRTMEIVGRHQDPVNHRDYYVQSLAVGASGKMLVSGSSDKTVGIWDLDKKTPPRFLKGHTDEVTSVAISPDERFIASASADESVKIWNAATGEPIHSVKSKSAGAIAAVAFSPDGKFLASGGADNAVSIWETETGNPVRTLTGHNGKILAVSFSSDGTQILSSGEDKSVRLWNVVDGREARVFNGHVGTVYSEVFLPDDRRVASTSADGSIIIWNKETGNRFATLMSFKDSDDWLVAAPQGFFDGSQQSWRQISWRFDNNTFNVRPVEEFFNEFWYPGLLSKLLGDQKLPVNTDISKKDRRQPELKLSLPDIKTNSTLSERSIKVKIDISKAPNGAKDLRLFRNGSLVKVWRGNIMKGQDTASFEYTLPLVAGKNNLTAYAFNADNIKSRDQSVTVTGAPDFKRKGIMYILSVGVNEYANTEFNLSSAVNDAKDFAEEFQRQQARLNNFEDIKLTTLYNAEATKSRIYDSLNSLKSKILPEDALVVFFAGHGIAKDNHFYLIPHDLGYAGGRDALDENGLRTILTSSVSDDELDSGVENIDAGQFLLVIDACNSGQAIQTDEMRQGPINSRGLAQLAYEKGIYILTAAQGDQSAKENARLGHGYLTYALVEEGLKTPAADNNKDGQVMLLEWLDYAKERVPQIDKQEMEKAENKARKIEREKATAAGKPDEGPQKPRAFYPRESGSQMLIARP